ncbi:MULTISPECIES: DUF7288 family protein [Haloarcula]|uniref:DUF7288 family protein n=1 Tax=Haloarcula TaxID=2237 RepID=UPI0023ED9BF4|nr:hypothetical protein [Halomicroarcula sp. XH51]
MSDRAQVFTLEALVSGMLLLGAVIFALQATAVTPQSATTASSHSVTQLERVAAGVLEDAAEDGSLKRTVLFWDPSEEAFRGLESYESGYQNGDLPTTFGEQLRRSFATGGVAYNVNVRYQVPGDDPETVTVVDSGTPSDDAVRVATLVTLYDDDPLYYDDDDNDSTAAVPSADTVSSGSFYAPDDSPGSGVYNVVSVEVVLWST